MDVIIPIYKNVTVVYSTQKNKKCIQGVPELLVQTWRGEREHR